MQDSDIVTRINQIADFFRVYPREEAIAGIALHIREFWDPRMRRALVAAIAAGAHGIDELALFGAKRVLASVPVQPAA